MPDKPWHSLDIQSVCDSLKVTLSGLTSAEAAERLARYGPNKLQARKKASLLKIFLSQFNNFLIYVLIAATIVSFLIGEALNAEIIAVVVVLNGILGFLQEYKAERSIESLRSLVVRKAFVIRDGHKIEVNASYIVPGDIIVVEAGKSVPADACIIESVNLKVDESALTGESEPSAKHGGVMPPDTALPDMDNMLFTGTTVLDGRAKAIVVATGMNTEIGRITSLVESGVKRATPIQVGIDRLGKFFGIAALIACLIIFIVGIIEGRQLYEMFLVSVSLAVAAIPEGLPATITIVLALGVQLMARRNAVVRKLTAVETLGSTSVICSDKTGTLTQNIIVTKKIITSGATYDVTGEGYSPAGAFISGGKETPAGSDPALWLLLMAGTLCNNATFERLENKWNILGDSTEAALLVASAKAGMNKILLEDDCPRILELPFGTTTKRMVTVNAYDGKTYAFMKGAPEIVLRRCDNVFKNGAPEPLEEEDEEYFLKSNEDMAKNGMRVLGFAYMEIEGDPLSISPDRLENGLTYLGLAGMIDPPRPEVKDSVKQCHDAGIDVVMITGDQKLTAIAIARGLGIYREGDIAVTGSELNDMVDEALDNIIGRVKVFARTSPEQKLRIVETLKRHDRVVAMTGDGVNDAPALKRADIGVAMGRSGTDVARQAADLVLMDDNFATIVKAVEDGRAIYENIKKVVKFQFSTNMSEVLIIFIGIIMGLPLPLIAVQILWVNLITDSFPALALSVDPADSNIMKAPPRLRSKGLIGRLSLLDMGLIGATITIGTLGIFYVYMPGGIDHARTMAFTTLVVFQLWNCLNCRSENRSLFSIDILGNKYLVLTILGSIVLQAVVLYMPFLEGLFMTTAPSAYDCLVIFLVTSTVFIVIEARKLAFCLLHIKT